MHSSSRNKVCGVWGRGVFYAAPSLSVRVFRLSRLAAHEPRRFRVVVGEGRARAGLLYGTAAIYVFMIMWSVFQGTPV